MDRRRLTIIIFDDIKVFHESGVTVWASVHSLAEGSMGGSRDGFHMSRIATSKVSINDSIHHTLRLYFSNVKATQMLLNLVCNDNMNFNDGTCCKSSDRPTSLQALNIVF